MPHIVDFKSTYKTLPFPLKNANLKIKFRITVAINYLFKLVVSSIQQCQTHVEVSFKVTLPIHIFSLH